MEAPATLNIVTESVLIVNTKMVTSGTNAHPIQIGLGVSRGSNGSAASPCERHADPDCERFPLATLYDRFIAMRENIPISIYG